MNIKRLIFKLCPKHRKCAQSIFDMIGALCDRKDCIIQNFMGIVNAYNTTKEKYEIYKDCKKNDT